MDDSKKDDRVKVAISTGDVDRAKHVSTVIPGMDNVPSEDIKDHVKNAELVHKMLRIMPVLTQMRWRRLHGCMIRRRVGRWCRRSMRRRRRMRVGSALEGIHASRQASGVGRAHTSLLGHPMDR